MALKSRVFRLFVSSTFSDFIEEREALQKYVFPKLEDYCAEQGARFQAVDLRWGITEEAQRDRETLQICLEEVRRCQEHSPRPNFAILLGLRYGWEPLPERISEDHWERLVKQLEELGAAKDKTALEMAYRADTNAVPPTYCLKSGDIEFDELEVQAILRRAAAHFVGSDRLPYFGSATHQEIAEGALGVEDASEHVYAYIRRIKNPPADSSATNFIDSDDSAVQRLDDLEKELRDQLAEDHVHEFDCAWNGKTVTQDHLKNFCDKFYQHQVALIEQELDRIKRDEAEQTTSALHHAFAEEQTEIFVGRESLLDQISEYLRSPAAPRSPLIATAEGGAGKTSIMARSYLQAAATAPSPSIGPVVLCRFIGGVAGMESLKSLLESLISDINAAYGGPRTNTNRGVDEASTVFKAALDHATAEKPLWIFIDALDQLEKIDNLPLSDWLPETLPAAVRLVLSARRETLPAAVRDNPNLNVIEIAGMALDEGDTLLARWLASSRHPLISAGASLSHGRTLTSKQRNLILGRFKENPNPLWLKLAYEEARRWHSWGHPKTLAGTVTEMVESFIGNHLIDQRKHPPIFTRKALSYIAAARYGLAEEEIAKALGIDPEVRKEFEDFEKTPTKWESAEQLPPILWSRLFLDLRPYLTSAFTDGAVVFRYFHREFRETIEKLYLSGNEKSKVHAHLAKVFSRPDAIHLYRQTDASEENQDSRAMRRIMEQPWQLAKSGQRENLRNLLMDFSFCMAKCAANRCDDLVQDYIRAKEIEINSDGEWRIWSGHIVGRIGHILLLGDQSWPAHRILLQLAIEHADDSPLTLAAEEWIKKCKIEWECQYLGKRPTKAPIEPCIGVFSHDFAQISGVKILSGNRVLTWADATLRIWDTNPATSTTELIGHSGSIRGASILKGERILSWSSDGTLRFWSSSGELSAVSTAHPHGIGGAIELSDGRILTWSDVCGIRDCKFFDGCVYPPCLKDYSLRLWSSNGQPLIALKGHSHSVNGAQQLSNGHILSWSKDGTLRLWSSAGAALAVFKGHEDEVLSASELSDQRILSRSYDCTARLWSPTAEPLGILHGHSSTVVRTQELRDGYFVSLSNGTPKFWSPDGNRLSLTTEKSDPNDGGITELSDGRLLSWSGATLKIWSPAGEVQAVMAGHSHLVSGAKELSDHRLLSWSLDSTIRLWSSTGQVLACMEGHTAFVNGVQELSNGRLVSWSSDRTVRLWSPEGNAITEFEGHTGNVTGAQALSDGRMISLSTDGTLRLWSSAGEHEEVIERLPEPGGNAHELKDGSLLSISTDRRLRLISRNSDTLIQPKLNLDYQSGQINLNDNLKIFWSGSEVQLKSSKNKDQVVLRGHSSLFRGAELLKNGHLLTWSQKEIIIWNIYPLIKETVIVLTGNLNAIISTSNGSLVAFGGLAIKHAIPLKTLDNAQSHES